MSKIYIGIDPGSKGYCTIIGGYSVEFIPFEDTPWISTANRLRSIVEETECFAVLEDVHAVYGSSASATFSFGENKGIIQGILTALKIPYAMIAPKEWQKEIWINSDKVYKEGKKIDTKKTSFNSAHRIFPDIDLRKNTRCTKEHDGKCDSLLIAEFARRKNY